MKPRTAKETAIICTAAVVIVGLLTIPFELAAQSGNNSRGVVWMAVAVVLGLGMVLGFRYLTTRKRGQLELAGSEQYRRLADLAITAQEHTDLKLGDVSAQLDFLREQNENPQGSRMSIPLAGQAASTAVQIHRAARVSGPGRPPR
jgi:predicted negative regulator of RcsB-dependent stress response